MNLLGLLGTRWVIYGLPIFAVALVASHAWARHTGVVSARNECAAEQLATVQQAIKTKDTLQARNDAIAAQHATQTQSRRVVYRTITREVAAHAASTAAGPCLDAIGMRNIRAAALGELPDAAAEFDRGLP